MIETGFAVIGTPDDYVAQIERLTAQSGGFGAFLHLDNHWADWAETKRSYELIARFAIPKINKLNANRFASEAWLRVDNDRFRNELKSAVGAKIAEHAANKGVDKLSPDFIQLFNAQQKAS
jgi:limonene 1,2-monooxygenase